MPDHEDRREGSSRQAFPLSLRGRSDCRIDTGGGVTPCACPRASLTARSEPMSFTEVVIEGTLKPDGTLELDQKPNLAPGRVRVVLRQESVPELPALSPDEWRRRILETAGKWQGEFERPEQGECEQREPL